jgi:urea transport system ATP-binding protein
VTQPKLLVLDEPTEGILRPSIMKEIEQVIRNLARRGDMVLRAEQYFDFARALADRYLVMDHGEVVLAGDARDMIEDDVRRHLTI